MPPYYEIDASSGRIPLKIIRQEIPLNQEEKQYLLAVERGDLPSVRQCLQEAEVYFNININCVDSLGRSSLLIAIQNENIELIELLLSYNIHVGDALLHAINEEVVEAVELLLNHKTPGKKRIPVVNIRQNEHDTDFTPDITPVILAAHRNNYEILKLLLEKGATIPKPHNIKCGCSDCISSLKHDGLRHSRSRLNTYRALASPSLIALASEDPILTAFELSWELRRLSKLENEFKKDYEELQDQCIQFARDLLDEVRGSNELEIILNRDSKVPTGIGESLCRLKLAIKFKQKPFVAHPNCQQLLLEIWYQGLPGWRRQHWILKFLMCCTVGLAFPIFSLVYLLAPNTSISKFVRLPFLKFISHSASYFVFLLLLVLASQQIGDQANRKDERGPKPTEIEWLIFLWVIGILWGEIKQLWDDGFKEYATDWWNLMDFIMLALYIAVIGLRITAYQQQYTLGLQANLPKESTENGTTETPYRREDWNRWDPTLIAEAIFSIANIFSYLRLISLFTANSQLGPLQISLGRMVGDITRFLIIFTLVLFAFAVGLNQLYWYYNFPLGDDGCWGVTCEMQNNVFSSLFESLETLIWMMFGQVDLSVVYLNGTDHRITEYIGATMLGCYAIITVIVLLNMLIAMMNTSFQDIQQKADEEWKFARSKLWISYFEEGSTLPPPFNIVPSPKFFYYTFKFIFRKIFRICCNKKRTKQAAQGKYFSIRKENDARYQDVMRKLIKRYITNMKRTEKADGISEDDLNELKQDVSAFRYEMLELMSHYRTQSGDHAVANTSRSQANGTTTGGPVLAGYGSGIRDSGKFGKSGRKKSRADSKKSLSEKRPLRVMPIKEEDYSMPDFLKVKNVKNVVTAVNHFRRSTKNARPLKVIDQLEGGEQLDVVAEEASEEECSKYSGSLANGQEVNGIELSELVVSNDPDNKISSGVPDDNNFDNREKDTANQFSEPNSGSRILFSDDYSLVNHHTPLKANETTPDSQTTSGVGSQSASFQSQESLDRDLSDLNNETNDIWREAEFLADEGIPDSESKSDETSEKVAANGKQ